MPSSTTLVSALLNIDSGRKLWGAESSNMDGIPWDTGPESFHFPRNKLEYQG